MIKNFYKLITDDNKFRLSIFIIVFFTGLAVWIFRILNLFNLYKDPHPGDIWFYDFHAYYDTARFLLSGKDIYNGYIYLYAPLTILFFLPLGFVSFQTAYTIMSIANIVFLILTTILITKILKYYKISVSKLMMLMIFIAIFLFYPVGATFTAGQVNILILFLITAFYYYLFVKNSRLIAGIFLNLATLLKVWPAILILMQLGSARAKIIKSFGIVFVILGIISLIIFGLSTNIKYLDTFLGYNAVYVGNYSQIRYPTDALDPGVSPTLSVLKLGVLFGINTKYVKIFLILLKISFMILIIYYFKFLRTLKNDQIKNQIDVLIFSTLIIAALALFSDITRVYYGPFLVLPYVLLIFVYKPNFAERLLLISSITLFSIHEGVILLANITGGILKSAIYIISPSAYAYIILLIFVVYTLRRYKIDTEIIIDKDLDKEKTKHRKSDDAIA